MGIINRVYIFLKMIKDLINAHTYMMKYSFHILRWGSVLIVIESVINVVFTPLFIIIPQYIIDSITKQDWNQFLTYIVFYIVLSCSVYGVQLVFRYYSTKVMRNASLECDMFFAKLRSTMPYELFESSEFLNEELSIRASIDVYNYFKRQLLLFECIINCFVYSSIIGQVHLIVAASVLLISVFRIFINNCSKKHDYDGENIKSSYKRQKAYLQNLMTNFDNGKEIRINNVGDWLLSKYKSVFAQEFKFSLNLQKKKYPLQVFQALGDFLLNIIVYSFAALSVFSQQITIGGFSTYVASISKLTGAFNGLITQVIDMNYDAKHINRLKNYMKCVESSIQNNGTGIGIDKHREKHTIEFVNVYFKYPQSEEYTIKNISFKLYTGDNVALIGFNGAGKTTIIKLLCGLYRPTLGRILFDGNDIWEIDMKGYRKMMSVMWQDYCLFPLSIKDNIVLDKTFEQKKWDNCISSSNLKKTIDNLPDGYNTCIGKELQRSAVELSGGQAQALIFSRLVYRNTPILILDEPTASLDPYMENYIFAQYKKNMVGKIGILVSHRMSFSLSCNKIFLLDSGTITESGTHTELMNKKGTYYKMFSEQAKYYIAEETNYE